MLKEILYGQSLNDTHVAFEKRKILGTKERKLNIKFFKKLIEEVDEQTSDWSAQNIRELFIKRYKNTF